MEKLPGPELRRLKAAAQLLKPLAKLGRQGATAAFIAALDQALTDHQLVKVKFEEFKEQRRELSRQLAEQTRSYIILQVGHTVVLYRAKPAATDSGPHAG